TALQGPNQSATYIDRYSPTRPIWFTGFPLNNLPCPFGFNVNPVTGDICFRPAKVQAAVIVIEVKEWRMVNGVMTVVGVTRRDMQIIVIPCPTNKVPRIISSQYTYQACA